MKSLFLPAADLPKIARKQAAVAAFRESGLTLKEYSAQSGIPLASLWRWNRAAGDQLDPSGLLDRRRIAARGSRSQIDRRCLAWGLCLVHRYPKAAMTQIHRLVCEKAKEEGWGAPGYKQFLRSVRAMPADMRLSLTEGARASFEQAQLVARREETALNRVAGVDFSELPVWVRDMATGELYKPYLTAHIDHASRAIMGVRQHRSTPDASEALKALHTALSPKGDERSPFFGVPVRLRSDHGSIYESADYLDALLRLNIIWDPSPVASPSSNGKIERWFGTFKNGLLTTLAGYANQFRGLSRAEKCAIPDSVFAGLVDQFVIRYNHTVHSEIGKTPFEAWMEGIGEAHGLNVPQETIDKAVQLRKEVTIERDGVHLYGRHFMEEVLVGMVGQRIVVRLPIEGTASEVEAFTLSGAPLGILRPVDHDADLASRINAARLSRNEDIRGLGATMRDILRKPASPAPVQPAPIPRGITPTDEVPLRAAPKLPVEE